jgi:hypothetical protein
VIAMMSKPGTEKEVGRKAVPCGAPRKKRRDGSERKKEACSEFQ